MSSMNDIEELGTWIRRLESKEGAESFKRTMGVGDAEVECEIQLAKNVINSIIDWENRLKTLNNNIGVM